MRRYLTVVLVVAALAAPAAPAAAGTIHHRYRDGRDDCGRNGGDCGHQRYSDDHQGGCNNFCPKFDKSPVDHSFNFSPVICLPGSTCNTRDDGDKKDQPPPKDAQDESIACLVPAPWHCDPRRGT